MDAPRQEQNREQSESEAIRTSGNGSGLTPAEKSPILGKATGPLTELGKRRASRNAIKHGVFSKVVVLKSESRAEYEKLWAELQEALQPAGALEELLVEKLATLAWRQRRLLLAESAEIQKNTEFVESDQRDQEREEAGRIASLLDSLNNHGLIQKIRNANVLERCLELLAELREQIEENGFDAENDSLQRMRLGQPVLPKLEVQHSLS